MGTEGMERRRHRRIDIKPDMSVQARTDAGPVGEKLLSLSLGGCSFAAPSSEIHVRSGQTMTCTFVYGGTEVQVEGTVRYVLPYPVSGQIGRFYGVEFRAEDQELMAPLVEVLLEHSDRGSDGSAEMS